MKKETIVNLEKPARKSGADRYEGMLDNKVWQVYIPQSISRDAEGIRKAFKITIKWER
jgi:hypothetical protein